MADTALGELRRPPRSVEHRLERIARWRAQGLANGSADSTFPSDATDAVAFASGGDATVTTGGAGGGGGAAKWLFDAFNLTSSTANSFALSATPIENSEVVRVNGLVLEPSEYVITGSTLVLDDIAAVRLGIGAGTWRLVLNYAYTDLATPGTAEDSVIGLGAWGYWKLNEPTTLAATEDVLDYSGNDRHGYYGVTVPAGLDQAPMRAGLSRCTTYDGSQDAVQIDHVQEVFDNGFTVTAWARPDDITGNQAVVGSTYEGSITLFKLCCHDGVWRCESYWDGNFQQPEGGLAVVGTAQWIAARYDGNVTIELFIDNVLIDTVTCTAPLPSGLSQDYLRIATRGDNTPVEQYVGSISDVAIWDRALTDDEMTTVYTGSGGASVIAAPGGDFTPPTPPATPGTHVLRYQRPDTTGYTPLDVAAGGTFTLDHTVDYAITASTPITNGYVRLVGGRNLDVYGLIFDFDPTIPTGSYDSARRGLHYKDGPNPNLKRVIYEEGTYYRSGYYSDGTQLAFRYENDVTYILQALRSDAYGWGQRSGVHSDLVQFYGGPLNFLGDCITGKNQTYQGIFMRAADDRSLPSGADKIDWQLSRTNLESADGPDGAARYLLWDDQPAWTGLTLDEVYIDGGRNDVTDSHANMPATGLFQNATPAGGDWAPASWWTGDVYTSPGYV